LAQDVGSSCMQIVTMPSRPHCLAKPRVVVLAASFVSLAPAENVRWLVNAGGELDCDSTCRTEDLSCVERCWPINLDEFRKVALTARTADTGLAVTCKSIARGGAWYDPSASLEFDETYDTRTEATCGWQSNLQDDSSRCKRSAGINSYRFCPCAGDVDLARCLDRPPPTAPPFRTPRIPLTTHVRVSDGRLKPFKPTFLPVAGRNRPVTLPQTLSSIWFEVCKYVSLAIGTFLGLAFLLLAGPGKLLRQHPIHYLMEFGFESLYGPYFGVKTAPFMTFVGVVDVIFGAGVLVGLWTTAFGLLDAETEDLANALLLCAFQGNLTMNITATMYHLHVEHNTGPTLVFAVLSCAALACRLVVSPLETFSSSDNAVFLGFSFVNVFFFCGAWIIRCQRGAPAHSLKLAAAELDSMKKTRNHPYTVMSTIANAAAE